ncbi:hypothetical protein DFR36_101581 [Melaminivora alkalimesophila]|uniref:Uncharacterized protein n=3 Tax=Melaminivora alkalimesophila TaxID=1165852 RepID=A0A317RKS0_9BURK|nr:hypothetical protein DFR36_101581 [Melaminivora alkalimesophila]
MIKAGMLRWLLALLTLHLLLGMAAPVAASARQPAPVLQPMASLVADCSSAAVAAPGGDVARAPAEAVAGADPFGADLPDEPALRRARADEPSAAHFLCPQGAPRQLRSSAPRRRLRPPRAA